MRRPCPPPLSAPLRPVHVPPSLACDAHCHVFGPAASFPLSDGRAYTPEDMPKERLFALHDAFGFDRRVIVQASCHGTDNAAMLDALAARPGSSRGVASLADDVSDAAIAAMHAAGVRGARFNFMSRIIEAPPLSLIDGWIERLAPLGWHVVLHFDPDQIPDLAPWISGLDIPVLIDHAGRLHASDYGGPNFDEFCRLMDMPHVWTKISGVERGSEAHAPWDDMIPILRETVRLAPDRTLWGTDWPHPVLSCPMPDDGKLVDYLWRVVPDDTVRHGILVDNPARLYDFGNDDR